MDGVTMYTARIPPPSTHLGPHMLVAQDSHSPCLALYRKGIASTLDLLKKKPFPPKDTLGYVWTPPQVGWEQPIQLALRNGCQLRPNFEIHGQLHSCWS
jgi:hypothetical protein